MLHATTTKQPSYTHQTIMNWKIGKNRKAHREKKQTKNVFHIMLTAMMREKKVGSVQLSSFNGTSLTFALRTIFIWYSSLLIPSVCEAIFFQIIGTCIEIYTDTLKHIIKLNIASRWGLSQLNFRFDDKRKCVAVRQMTEEKAHIQLNIAQKLRSCVIWTRILNHTFVCEIGTESITTGAQNKKPIILRKIYFMNTNGNGCMVYAVNDLA